MGTLASIILILGQVMSPEPSVPQKTVPFDGITIKTESLLRNEDRHREVVEIIRETFDVQPDTLKLIEKEFRRFHKSDLLYYNNNFEFLTISLTGYRYREYKFVFHNKGQYGQD